MFSVFNSDKKTFIDETLKFRAFVRLFLYPEFWKSKKNPISIAGRTSINDLDILPYDKNSTIRLYSFTFILPKNKYGKD